MRCDLHVHSLHSGTLPVAILRHFFLESYSAPADVYSTLRKRGMDLVTLTDHDSIGGGEELRKHADFFLSEEVTCRMPSGTYAHVGVYDLSERQHTEINRRRDDLIRLVAYLSEQRLFFTVNHVFSSLTGRRKAEDFEWFSGFFPAVETRNGQMLPSANQQAAEFAWSRCKTQVAGSDAHALASVGTTYTEVPGARDKEEFFAGLRAGPPERDLDLGPMINANQKRRVEAYLAGAAADHLATLATGTVVSDAPKGGYYVRPTLIGAAPETNRIVQEEVFGPVLAAMTFEDEADAIRLANGTPFGLVAGVWSRDAKRAIRVARKMRAGQVFVNSYGAGGGIELPFGGFGRSGHGREKGFEGLREFTTTQTLVVAHGE